MKIVIVTSVVSKARKPRGSRSLYVFPDGVSTAARMHPHRMALAQKCKGIYGNAAGNARIEADPYLAVDSRGASGIAPGFHERQFESGNFASRHSDGFGDGAGVSVCSGRCVLGRKTWSRRRGNDRIDRIDAEPRLRGGAWTLDVHDGDGRPAHRGERSRRRGGRRGASYRARLGDYVHRLAAVRVSRAKAARMDGSIAERRCGRVGIRT